MNTECITLDDVRTYLDQAVGIDSDIISVERQLKYAWHKLMIRPGSDNMIASLSDIKVQTSKFSGWNEENLKAYLDLESIRTQLKETQQTIVNQINSLDSCRYRTLLRDRYIVCLTWKEIADDLGYSEDHCRRELHDKALGNFRKKFQENIKCFLLEKSEKNIPVNPR